MCVKAFRLTMCSIAAIVLATASQAAAQVGRTRTARVVATLPATSTSGVCTAPSTPIDYSMVCESGDCGCFSFDGTITGNLVNKGTAAFLLNVDFGLPAAPTTSTTGADTCSPVFGTITTNTTTGRGQNATPVTTTFNVVGALCTPLTNRGNGSFNGGYGILSQDTSPALSGYGSIVSTIDPQGNLVIKMKGPAS